MKVASSSWRPGVAAALLFLAALAAAVLPQQGAWAQRGGRRSRAAAAAPMVPTQRHPMAGGGRFLPGDVAVRSLDGVTGFGGKSGGRALLGGSNGANIAEKVVDITQQKVPDEITPFWTSDEKFLYYASNENPANPANVSASGKYGLFRISAAVPSIVTAVSAPTALTPNDGVYDYKFPAIDASGSRIAFVRSSDGGAHWNLYVSDLPAAGNIDTTINGATNLRSLTFNATTNAARTFVGQPFVTVGRPSWIGQSDLVFAAKVGGDPNYHLYSVNINADNNGNYTVTQLTGGAGDEENPAVSPDGKEVAFDANAAGYVTGQPRTELLPGNVPTAATGTAPKRDIFIQRLANAFGGAQNYSVDKITSTYAGATPTNNVEPAWSAIQNNPVTNPQGNNLFLAFASTRQAQYDPTDPTRSVVQKYVDGPTFDVYTIKVTGGANGAQYPFFNETGLSGNGTQASNAAVRIDTGDDTFQYNDEYPTYSPFQTVQRVGFQSDRTGTYLKSGFGVGFTSTAPAHDLFVATVIDITAPTLLRFDTGSATGEIVHINPVTDPTNPYNANVSVRTRDQGILPGSTLFFTVRVDDRESGLRPDKAVFLQFKNPNSKYQSQAQGGNGVEHKEFATGAYVLDESSGGGYVPLNYGPVGGTDFGSEFDAEVISAKDRTTYFQHPGNVRQQGLGNSVYTPGLDDAPAFAGEGHPPLDGTAVLRPNAWLELKPLTTKDANGNTVPVLPADGKGGILYGASWKIPDEASDWFIDVILYDNAVNPYNPAQKSNFIIYDNVWGFSSALPLSPAPVDILVVSDYALGQKFFRSRFNSTATGGNNLSGPNSWGSESYFTDVDVTKLPAANSQAPPAPGSTTGRFWDPVGPFYVTNGPIPRPGSIAVGIPNTLGVRSYVDTTLTPGSQTVDNYFLPPTSRYSIWRVLARGPVPASLLQSYLPQTVSAPADVRAGESAARSKLVYNRMVIWNSPLAGDLFVGPGTITDLQTQNDLTSFVKSGGRLFISGQDIGFALAGSGQANDFFTNTLQAAFVTDDANTDQVNPTGTATSTIVKDAWTRAVHSYGGNFDGTFYTYEAANAYLPLWIVLNTNSRGLDLANARGDAGMTAAFGTGRNDVVAATGTGNAEYAYGAGTAMISSKFGSGRVLYSALGFESISNDWFTYTQGNNTYVATRGTRAKIMHDITCSFRTGTITGRVIDNNGSPVAGVLVRAVPTVGAEPNAAEGTAVTDAQGNYAMQGVTPDEYEIYAYKAGFFTQHTTGAPVHGGYQISVNLALKAANPGALGGVPGTNGSKGGIFAADGKTPVPGITIQVLHVDPQNPNQQVLVAQTKSQSDGSYSFTSLPVDTTVGYEVIANPAGPNYVAGYATVILKAPPQPETRLGQGTTVLPGLNPDGTPNPALPGRLLIQENVTAQVDFLLPANPQSLHGRVLGQDDVNGTNKAPLAGATVVITSTTLSPAVSVTLTTDANGNYDTATLPNGTGLLAADTYTVTATKAGYDTQSATVTVGGPNPTAVPDILLTKQAPGTIVGQVQNPDGSLDTRGDATLTLVDATTNQPVSYQGLTNPVKSDANTPNNYTFSNVPPGTYYITVTVPGYIVKPNPSPTFTVVTKQTTTGPTFKLSAFVTYGAGIQLISTPNDYSNIDPRDLFGLTAGSAAYNAFQVATWDPAGQTYAIANNTPLQPGVGYFVYFPVQASVTKVGQQRIQNNDPNTFVLNLPKGWNLIGNPFGTVNNPSVDTPTVDLGDPAEATFTYALNGGAAVSKDLTGAAADGAVQSNAFRYSGSLAGSQYFTTRLLAPWYGYWFYAATPVTVTLHPPAGSDTRSVAKAGAAPAVPTRAQATAATRAAAAAFVTRSIVSAGPTDWRIQLAARQGDLLDTDNSVGVAPGAKDGFDGRFTSLKPPAVSQAPSLYLAIQGKGPDGRSAAALADSVVPSTSGTKSWEFTVQSQPDREVTVYWPNITRLPRNLDPVLVDEDTNQRVLMRSGAGSYRYVPKGAGSAGAGVTHHFRVEVGPAASRPLALTNVNVSRVAGGAGADGRAAAAGYRFRFTATQEADVTAEVQTLAGRTLRRLQTRAVAGQPSDILWDGRDDSGSGLPAGAYVVNLTARDARTGAVVRLRVPVLSVR